MIPTSIAVMVVETLWILVASLTGPALHGGRGDYSIDRCAYYIWVRHSQLLTKLKR